MSRGTWDDEIDGEFQRVHKSVATEEEIEALALPETLSDGQWAQELLASHNELQHMALVRGIPRLICSAREDTLQVISSNAFTRMLHKGNDQLHTAAAESIYQLLQKGEPAMLQPSEVNSVVLPLAKHMVDRTEKLSTEASLAWREVLLLMHECLPVDTLQEAMLKWTVDKARHGQPQVFRILSCACMGKLAGAMQAGSAREGVLEVALGLCQDSDYEVRNAICQVLPALVQALDAPTEQDRVVTELLELLNDEMPAVKGEAFTAMVEVLDIVDPSVRREKLLPHLKRACREVPEELVVPIAQHLGKAVVKVHGDLEADGESHLFYETFKGLAERPVEQIRRWCAYNIPAMCKSVGTNKYMLHFHPLLNQLASDSSPTVRATIAAGFHEICLLLSDTRATAQMKEPLLRLMSDESPLVHRALLGHLGATLQSFRTSSETAKKANSELAACGVELAEKIGACWRQQELLVGAWALSPCCLCGHDIYEHIIPALFRVLRNRSGADSVTHTATRTLCTLLRRNRSRIHRTSITKRIGRDFAHGKTWRDRFVYLDFCDAALEQFSHQLVKSSFAEDYLDLAGDPVPNVRIRFLEVLPRMRAVLRPGSDDAMLAKLEAALGQCEKELDPGVLEMLAKAKARLAGIVECQVLNAQEEARERMLQEEEEDLLSGDEGVDEGALDSDDGREAAIEAAMKNFLSEERESKKMRATPRGPGRGARRSAHGGDAPYQPQPSTAREEGSQRPDSPMHRKEAIVRSAGQAPSGGAQTSRTHRRRFSNTSTTSGARNHHQPPPSHVEVPELPEAYETAKHEAAKRDMFPSVRGAHGGSHSLPSLDGPSEPPRDRRISRIKGSTSSGKVTPRGSADMGPPRAPRGGSSGLQRGPSSSSPRMRQAVEAPSSPGLSSAEDASRVAPMPPSSSSRRWPPLHAVPLGTHRCS